jgi:hypothetical protein
MAPVHAPGTADARRAILQPLSVVPPTDAPIELGHVAPQESPAGCGKIALVAGAVTAVAGVLLAVVVDSALPWEDETSSTVRYLVAGGVGFGVGAGYTLVGCRIERSQSLR